MKLPTRHKVKVVPYSLSPQVRNSAPVAISLMGISSLDMPSFTRQYIITPFVLVILVVENKSLKRSVLVALLGIVYPLQTRSSTSLTSVPILADILGASIAGMPITFSTSVQALQGHGRQVYLVYNRHYLEVMFDSKISV